MKNGPKISKMKESAEWKLGDVDEVQGEFILFNHNYSVPIAENDSWDVDEWIVTSINLPENGHGCLEQLETSGATMQTCEVRKRNGMALQISVSARERCQGYQ